MSPGQANFLDFFVRPLSNFSEKCTDDQLTNILTALDADVPSHNEACSDFFLAFGEVMTDGAAKKLHAGYKARFCSEKFTVNYTWVATAEHLKRKGSDGFCILQPSDNWVVMPPGKGSLLWPVNCAILFHRLSETVFVVVHLPNDRTKQVLQAEQVKKFIAKCERTGRHCIVKGDFNFADHPTDFPRMGGDQQTFEMHTGVARAGSDTQRESPPFVDTGYNKTCRVNFGVAFTPDGSLTRMDSHIAGAPPSKKKVSAGRRGDTIRKANSAEAKAHSSDHVGVWTAWRITLNATPARPRKRQKK